MSSTTTLLPSTVNKPLPSSVRRPELDGVRGMAILMVLVFHYTSAFEIAPRSAVYYLLLPLHLTWSGVDLFFVLSGLLIGGILIDHKESPRYYTTFYLRRIHRIFPIYYIMVGLLIVGTALWPASVLFQSPMPAWPFVLFVQNCAGLFFHSWGPAWLSVTWSLAIEEQFYLVLPLFIRLAARRWIPFAIAMCIAGAPLFRALMVYLGYRFEEVHPLLPCRADTLGWGVVVALVLRSGKAEEWVSRHYRAGYLLAAVMALSLVTLLKWTDYRFVGTVGYSMIGFTYFLLILLLLIKPLPALGKIFHNRWLRWLGGVSYCAYLIHEPIRFGLFDLLIGSRVAAGWAGVALSMTGVAVTLGIAQLSWIYLEQPLVRRAQTRYKY